MKMSEARESYQSIQVMRAMAALMVVLFHIAYHYDLTAATSSPILQLGWLSSGVDIFFVISGFVMVVSTEGRSLSARDFMTSRVRRIVPLYWFYLLLALAFMALGIMERPLPDFDEIVKSFLFIFYLDEWTGQAMPFLNVGWSLNYEMYFYILFAAGLSIALAGRIALIAAFFAAMVAVRILTGVEEGFIFRMTSPIPFEFVAGMVLGWRRKDISRIPPTAGFFLIVAGFALIPLLTALPRTIGAGIPAAMIVAGAVAAEAAFRGRAMASLRLIGDASYTLYLNHVFVLAVLASVGWFALPPAVGAVGAVILCIPSALAGWRWIERPIENRLRQFQQQRRSSSRAEPGAAA